MTTGQFVALLYLVVVVAALLGILGLYGHPYLVKAL